MSHQQWDFFWGDLNPIKGSEQSGRRPLLIVSVDEANNVLPVVGVLPLTSSKPGRTVYPTEVFLQADKIGLPVDSIAMAHQIRVVSKERLIEKCGAIEDPTIRQSIRNAIRVYLDL